MAYSRNSTDWFVVQRIEKIATTTGHVSTANVNAPLVSPELPVMPIQEELNKVHPGGFRLFKDL